jgi:hypothetical protein
MSIAMKTHSSSPSFCRSFSTWLTGGDSADADTRMGRLYDKLSYFTTGYVTELRRP